VTKTSWRALGGLVGVVAAVIVAAGCAGPKPGPATVPPTPTPFPLSRTNPNIVEEDELHIVERLPKEDYIRVDDRHIRHPVIAQSVEFFKEDEKYYYVHSFKRNTELDALAKLERPTPTPKPPRPGTTPTPAGPPLSDFEDLSPARVSGRLRLQAVASTGLPEGGLWRASFVVADMNGDGIPDIVSPPGRLGDGKLHVWIGDGKGHFSPWPLQFFEEGKLNPAFSLDYGGVAVGDIDGDGHLDVVAASHAFGLVSLFGDGKGTFRVVRTGLPGRDFSSQAVVLADVDGDGKLDIVASSDTISEGSNLQSQVRVYRYRGDKGWEFKPDGIVGGFYSSCLHAWDFDGDGKSDVLTGSHYIGALTLLWRSLGNGQFAPVRFPDIEIYAYHFATAPGTFGKDRAPAFVDSYYMITNTPSAARAAGLTLYSFQKGNWVRHRVWRKKSGQTSQYAVAMGDLDGDGLDDIVFPDSEANRLRIFFQQSDGTFVELAEKEEPPLDSQGQCVRLADVDRDGRLDILLSKTVPSYRGSDSGGWSVFLNKR
jgi:VCBS repeat protein